VENVLGCVLLMPCYLKGNLHNTIPHSLLHAVLAGAAADSRPDSRTGSRLFEVNILMWRYGRAFPRKISVADAEEMLQKRVQEARWKGAETLKHRRSSEDWQPLPGRQNKFYCRSVYDIVYYIIYYIVLY
jgi:hypothetical protein